MDLENDKKTQLGAEPRAMPPLEPERGAVPVDLRSWPAEPTPRRIAPAVRDTFDTGTVKIILILAGLTAGMIFVLKSLF